MLQWWLFKHLVKFKKKNIGLIKDIVRPVHRGFARSTLSFAPASGSVNENPNAYIPRRS